MALQKSLQNAPHRFKYIGVRSWGGAIGESTIVDYFSRDIHVILLHSKRHFLDKFKTWMSHNVSTPKDHVPIAHDSYPQRERQQVNPVCLSQAFNTSLPSRISFSDATTDPMIRDAMTKTITDLYNIPAIQEDQSRLGPSAETRHRWKPLTHQISHFPQGFRFRDGIDFNQDEVASYAPHVQISMIGFHFEVQRSMYTTHLDVTNCFQVYSLLPTTSRIILDTPDGSTYLTVVASG
jgi:hypothetical protein